MLAPLARGRICDDAPQRNANPPRACAIMLARNDRGDVLEEFLPGTEEQLLIPGQHLPLTHAVVVAHHHGRYLLMLNRWKRRWEVPGGKIDPGESPRECAARELLEETGRTVVALTFLGLIKLRLQPDSRLEYGALYRGLLFTEEGPSDSAEAEQITFWDLRSALDPVDAIDRTLLDLCPDRRAMLDQARRVADEPLS